MGHNKRQKLLILHSRFGDGHLQAARAIQEATQLQQTHLEPLVIDFMNIHPFIYPVSRYVFINGVKKFPSAYGYLFRKTREINSSKYLKTFHFLSMRRMMKLLNDTQPSIVVSTFPLAAATMSMLKAYGLTQVPAITVITDHTDHSIWIHSHTDQYIVGSYSVRQSLLNMGIPISKISVTGIPVHPKFSKTYSREALREKHGLDQTLPTILVAGGGYGLMRKGLSPVLNNLSQKIQLIFVCGHNEKLRKQLTEKFKSAKHPTLVTGYIDYMHELMALSDLLVTKPGGLTTAEAMALELPMLFMKPSPGQEQDNARLLINAGVAIQANDNSELIFNLEKLLKNPGLIKNMREKAKLFHAKRAAFDALDIVNNCLENFG